MNTRARTWKHPTSTLTLTRVQKKIPQIQNRDQSQLELLRLFPATGEMKPIMLEQAPADAWNNLHNIFHPLKKADEFVWASERTGFQHLYLYNYDGQVVRQLTDGKEVCMYVSMYVCMYGQWLCATMIGRLGASSQAVRMYVCLCICTYVCTLCINVCMGSVFV
jgi:hypothetical protein